MANKELLYGFNDPDNAIVCTLQDITFNKMDILYKARTEDGDTIIAPIEMFKEI